MKTLWLIECVAYSPSVYISTSGGLTGKPLKAMSFNSKEEAEEKRKALKLSSTWEPVQRTFPSDHAAA